MLSSYIDKNTSVISSYQPSNDVREFTIDVQKDYALGDKILTDPCVELNDRSVLEDEDRGQRMFNGFVDESVEDPNQAWKWRGTRSMARNKGIAMHANLTANYLLPLFMAQNENDDVDRDFSEIMRDIIEWMASPTVSNYQSSFLQAVFGAITNPVTYLGAEYCEVMQTIKEKQADGTYTTKEILDEVLSGFQAPIWSSSQILITNKYERNIQKQRRIIKRRYVEKAELEAKWGEHPHWPLLQVGIRSVYNADDQLFYDVKDDDHPYLVIEETAMSRRDDTEVCFLGGIYFGDTEDIDNNPMYHRDNRGAPKYNVVPFGYSRIGEHFFYYKSMMNAVGWDNMLYDAMSEVVMNRAFLEVDMPVVITGADDKVDSEIVFPNSVVTMENENGKVSPMLPSSNMAAGFSALRETEKSLTEGSVSETISGQLPDASQKAFSVAQAQANSRKLIGAVAKSIAESVIMYGDLMKDIAINHITVPEVDELVSGAMKLKYRSFLIKGKQKGGSVVNRRIKFDSSLIGATMTDAEKKQAEMALLEESGYPENKDELILVNPEMFAHFKYLTTADVEEMFSKNAEYWQPILLNLKTALANDPYTNQEALTRKLMYSFFQSGSDDLVQKPSTAPSIPQQIGAPAAAQLPSGNPAAPKLSPLSPQAPSAVA